MNKNLFGEIYTSDDENIQKQKKKLDEMKEKRIMQSQDDQLMQNLL